LLSPNLEYWDKDTLIQEVKALRKTVELTKQYGVLPEVAFARDFLRSVKAINDKKLKCFISYAWCQDNAQTTLLQAKLEKIKADLAEVGIEVMLDIHNMEGDINKYMAEGIKACDRVLVICTPRFRERFVQTGDKNNLQKEIFAALDRQQSEPNFIIPLLLEGNFSTSVPTPFHNILCVDLSDSNNYYKNLTSLSPKGLIPMILSLENNIFYKALLTGYHCQLALLDAKK